MKKKMITTNKLSSSTTHDITKHQPRSRDSTLQHRVHLFILVRILFQYLEKVDPELLLKVKDIVKDCGRKHANNQLNYGTLAEAINDRLRSAVGNTHWNEAKKIQKRVIAAHKRRKMIGVLKERNEQALKMISEVTAQIETFAEGER